MNTLIYLWLDPLVMNHEKCDKKIYLNCIVSGARIPAGGGLDTGALDSMVEGEIMGDIMDFADIDQNWNFGCISASLTSKEPGIEFTLSPEETKQKKAVAKVVSSKKELKLSATNFEIKDSGQIELSVPVLGVKQTIDFAKIWSFIEKNWLGKIQPGDNISLTDPDGNRLFKLQGGSFLAPGNGDILVKGKDGECKGGLYLREDGSLDIGDMDRTFYLQIYTGPLLKASLKLDKTIMGLTETNLLKKPAETTIGK